MKKWILLGLAIVSEVTATLSLRASIDNSYLYILVAIGYLLAFYVLAQVIKLGTPVGVAYGIWAAFGVSLTAILATFIFHEPFTLFMGIGIVIIIGGVLLAELGSGQNHNKGSNIKEQM